MCGYSCYLFGASYPDAECIEGYMWDSDSYDGKYLTSGGDIPCPSCNTANCIDHYLDNFLNDIPQPSDGKSPAMHWESLIKECLKVNEAACLQHLQSLKPFTLLDWRGRIDSEECEWDEAEEGDEDVISRPWPWAVPDISNHQVLAMHPRPAQS